MQLTPHFALQEFTSSDVAARLGIDNEPGIDTILRLRETAAMLERIRDLLTHQAGRPVPILISSGYRCPALNRAIGGAPHSDHLLGYAADWTAPEFGSPAAVAAALAPQVEQLGIGQLILEFGRWVHTAVPQKATASRVITINQAGLLPGIVV